MRILLLGCPGAGKGTQARYLAKRYHIPLIATGDMLRTIATSGTTLGQRVRQIMESGALVSDEIIVELVKERLSHQDCQTGYLLDGFPRTTDQAEALDNSGVVIDYVIEIFVPDNNIVERLSNRRIHPGSGRVYNLKYNPPKIPDIDDTTGEALVQRDDDNEETIRERLRVYHEKTEPLVKYYQLANHGIAAPRPKYAQINGTYDIGHVQQQIVSFLTKQHT